MKESTKGIIEEKIVVFCMFFAICIILFCFQHRIIGAAVGLDEMEYFNLGRRLHEYGEFSSRQYNVLYPLIISFAFFADKLSEAYDIIKILNILLMASSIVPAYLISKKMIGNRIISYIVAFAVSMLPRCATTLLIWAEPLFYPLSLWGSLIFFEFIDKESVGDVVKLAIVCFLLYLTKQAGIVFIIAVEITLIFDYINNNKKNLKMYLISFCANIMPTVLMILYNKLRGESAMGYAEELNNYVLAIYHPLTIFKLFIYQLSDVILMSFFIFFVVFFVTVLNIRKELKSNQSKYIMIALWTIGILILAALHRTPANGELTASAPLTYSRYTCVVVPLILIVAVKQIIEYRINFRWIIICSIIFAVCCVVFSPVSSAVYSYGFISNSGLSYMTNFVHGFNHIWWSKEEVSVFYTVVLVLFFLSISIMALSKNSRIRTIGLTLFAVFSLWTGIETTRLVCRICGHQNSINEIYRYLTDFDIDKDEFMFDEQLLESNHSLYMYNYMWYGVKEINENEVTTQYLISRQEYSYELVFSTSDGYMVYKLN